MIDVLMLHGMFMPGPRGQCQPLDTAPGKSPSRPKHTMLTVPAQATTAKDISHENTSLVHYLYHHSLNPFPINAHRQKICPCQLPLSKSVNMSNTNKQHQGAAHDQHAWSTIATNGSAGQTRSDLYDTSATETDRSSSGTNTPFAVQRWLAEKPHEGPWNGIVVSRRPSEQAGKHN